jgi:hypothetical protein
MSKVVKSFRLARRSKARNSAVEDSRAGSGRLGGDEHPTPTRPRSRPRPRNLAPASAAGVGSCEERHASAVWFLTVNGMFFESEDENEDDSLWQCVVGSGRTGRLCCQGDA